MPEGSFVVEKLDVSEMPPDQFFESEANVCGFELQHEPDKIVFEKQSETFKRRSIIRGRNR